MGYPLRVKPATTALLPHQTRELAMLVAVAAMEAALRPISPIVAVAT
jgi:hypothetical protein